MSAPDVDPRDNAPSTGSGESDPVRQRRARVAHWVRLGQRVGYAALASSIVAFVLGAATDFPSWSVSTAVALLVTAIVVLPVPIVLGYGVRAAEREDRARGTR